MDVVVIVSAELSTTQKLSVEHSLFTSDASNQRVEQGSPDHVGRGVRIVGKVGRATVGKHNFLRDDTSVLSGKPEGRWIEWPETE